MTYQLKILYQRMVRRLQRITNTTPLPVDPIEKQTSGMHFKHSDKERNIQQQKSLKKAQQNKTRKNLAQLAEVSRFLQQRPISYQPLGPEE